MNYVKLPFQQLMLAHPDGVPLPYAKRLLPFQSRFNLHAYLHLHLHASYYNSGPSKGKKPALSKQKLINLLKGLEALIHSFTFEGYENIWGNYYEEAATRTGYLEEKKSIISAWLSSYPDIKSVVDIGGNQGEFAILALSPGRRVICADGEHFAIDSLYKKIRQEGIKDFYPLCLDIVFPSPAIGVNNEERASFLQRASSDLAMGLALIHHLAIGRNIPFSSIAKTFAQLGRFLIIEFVPKEDEKVKVLLQHKKDIYVDYNEEAFLRAFACHYRVIDKRTLSSSQRTLYLMESL